MKLKTLKPRLQSIGGRVQTLAPTRPSTVERKRGSAGVKDRNKIRERDCRLCQLCQQAGRVAMGAVVDHRVPLLYGLAAPTRMTTSGCSVIPVPMRRPHERQQRGRIGADRIFTILGPANYGRASISGQSDCSQPHLVHSASGD